MGIVPQLILGGVFLAALAGGFYSWKADIRAEGEQKILERQRELQAERDRENARLAQEGEAKAKELLAVQQRRTKEQAAKLAATQQLMREQSDARAKVDISYALWRETPLPDYVDQRVRNAYQPAAQPSGYRVPGGIAVPARPDPAALAHAEVDQPGLARIRGILGLGDSGLMASRR